MMTNKELIQWRKDLGFTQRDMAAYLGYSLAGYRKLEQGINSINDQLARTIDVLQFVEIVAPDIAQGLKPNQQ